MADEIIKGNKTIEDFETMSNQELVDLMNSTLGKTADWYAVADSSVSMDTVRIKVLDRRGIRKVGKGKNAPWYLPEEADALEEEMQRKKKEEEAIGIREICMNRIKRENPVQMKITVEQSLVDRIGELFKVEDGKKPFTVKEKSKVLEVLLSEAIEKAIEEKENKTLKIYYEPEARRDLF